MDELMIYISLISWVFVELINFKYHLYQIPTYQVPNPVQSKNVSLEIELSLEWVGVFVVLRLLLFIAQMLPEIYYLDPPAMLYA